MSVGTPEFPLRLAELAPSSWRWRAACRNTDTGDFFDEGFEDIAVTDYCRPCPVRRECLVEELQVSMTVTAQEGVRGLTAGDRRRLIRYLRANDLEPCQLTLGDIEAHDRHLSPRDTGVRLEGNGRAVA